MAGAHVEARRLAINRDDLVSGARSEQEPVRLIADRGLMEKAFDRAGITSEHAEIEMAANEPAKLLDHLKGITQQIAFHAREG